MRLVINSMSIAPGGALSVLLGLLEGWRTIGADLQITILTYREATLAALREAGWGEPVQAIPVSSNRAATVWQRWKLPGVLRDLRPDVLLTNNYHIPGAPCPQVVHYQNLWSVYSPGLWPYARKGMRRLLLTLAARAALRKAEANVFISGYMRTCAEALVPASAPRNHVIYNGLNAQYQAAARALSANPPSQATAPSDTICALQSKEVNKDTGTLIAAFAELVRRAPQRDWRLRIIGGGGRDYAAWAPWREMAARLGVGDRVEFLGHLRLAAIAELFRTAACLVYPSVFEGFGMPILEAMAMGCPVVTVDATALPEVAGGAALLVPPHSPARVVEAVLALHDDAALRREMIRKGLERALAFPWTRSAEQFAELFQKVCALRPG